MPWGLPHGGKSNVHFPHGFRKYILKMLFKLKKKQRPFPQRIFPGPFLSLSPFHNHRNWGHFWGYINCHQSPHHWFVLWVLHIVYHIFHCQATRASPVMVDLINTYISPYLLQEEKVSSYKNLILNGKQNSKLQKLDFLLEWTPTFCVSSTYISFISGVHQNLLEK